MPQMPVIHVQTLVLFISTIGDIQVVHEFPIFPIYASDHVAEVHLNVLFLFFEKVDLLDPFKLVLGLRGLFLDLF